MWGYGSGFTVCFLVYAFRKRFFQRSVKAARISRHFTTWTGFQIHWNKTRTNKFVLQKVQMRCSEMIKFLCVVNKWMKEWIFLPKVMFSYTHCYPVVFIFHRHSRGCWGRGNQWEKPALWVNIPEPQWFPTRDVHLNLIMSKHQTNPEWGTQYKTDDLHS